MYKIIGADGNQYGPVTLEEVKSWVRDRRANGETLVQGPGMNDWRPLRTFTEFSDVLAMPAMPVYPGMMPPQKIDDYLVPAILVTLCCCLPAGVVAIVYAAQVKSKCAIGDWAGAQEASSKAKTWVWVSVGAGLLANGGMFFLALLGGF